MRVLSAMPFNHTGRQRRAYDRAVNELSEGVPGQNDHALRGQGGMRARDVAGSGKGRGMDRIIYKVNNDGSITIVNIGDYH
jgi:hypothetical protein